MGVVCLGACWLEYNTELRCAIMERRGGEARPQLLEEGLATQIAELRADLSGQDLQAAAKSGRWEG